MIEAIETAAVPVIGKYYLVPTVWNCVWKQRIPIFGPLHEDAEFLDFPHQHWHIDWRFTANRFHLSRVMERTHRSPQYLYGIVTNLNFNIQFRGIPQHPHLETKLGVQTKRLMMKREWPEYPPTTRVPWLHALEKGHRSKRLPACKTCPHRGISLKQIQPVNGVLICPGHGLRWDAKTGKLIMTPKHERFIKTT